MGVLGMMTFLLSEVTITVWKIPMS
jgi:hypothetical protein